MKSRGKIIRERPQKTNNKPTIGFIGQGWIGKNYANDFENRGFDVTRYSVEPQYAHNKDKIKDCDIVFIAVPTPTTEKGYDYSIIPKVIPLIREGKIVVIKSSLITGLTKKLAKQFPKHIILHSPEFLVEATAAHDAAHPDRNIVGIPFNNEKYKNAAEQVIKILAKAPFNLICDSSEAEVIKYSHNIHGYLQVVFSNLLYDYTKKFGGEWENIAKAIKADWMMSPRYLSPIHKSGRGAGGDCFIKDFKAFAQSYTEVTGDTLGAEIFRAFEEKNNDLLISTKKDLALLTGVYGKKYIEKKAKEILSRGKNRAKKLIARK